MDQFQKAGALPRDFTAARLLSELAEDVWAEDRRSVDFLGV